MNILALLITIVIGALLYLLTRRIQAGERVGLRPLEGFNTLNHQVGRAIESGRRVHYGLGGGGLNTEASPTSLAALVALEHLAEDGCASDVPPLVTVGDGTLLPAAQDQLRGAYRAANRQGDFKNLMVEFVAAGTEATSYAAGVSDTIQHSNAGSNLLMGRFGPEIGIILEAANRNDVEQIVGSDDPVALGVGTVMSDAVIIGEELFAAGAYLNSSPSRLASLQIQDILRYVIIIIIVLFAIINLILGI